MRLYFKYKPYEKEYTRLELALDVDVDDSYSIVSGKLFAKYGGKNPIWIAITPDNFSRIIKEYDLDENDIRMEIEEILENRSKMEIV